MTTIKPLTTEEALFMEDKGSVTAPEPINQAADGFVASVLSADKGVKEPNQRKQDTARWSKNPSHPEQLSDYPDTAKASKVKVITFKLDGNADEEAKYAAFIARTMPAASPEIVIESEKTKFYKGVWHIFAKYVEVIYQKI